MANENYIYFFYICLFMLFIIHLFINDRAYLSHLQVMNRYEKYIKTSKAVNVLDNASEESLQVP